MFWNWKVLIFALFLKDAIIGNPIHTYKMMKRFNVDLKKIEAEVLKGEEKWEGDKSFDKLKLWHLPWDLCDEFDIIC